QRADATHGGISFVDRSRRPGCGFRRNPPTQKAIPARTECAAAVAGGVGRVGLEENVAFFGRKSKRAAGWSRDPYRFQIPGWVARLEVTPKGVVRWPGVFHALRSTSGTCHP